MCVIELKSETMYEVVNRAGNSLLDYLFTQCEREFFVVKV